jgi:DNA-binding response OmpR family regulator
MQKRHVLVIEDDPGVQEFVRMLFEEEGFRVSVASNMASAREVLDRGGVVLMVSDEILPREPGLTGPEEASARKKPLLVITGNNDAQIELRERGIEFLPKPFKIAELHRRIDELIGRNEPDERHPGGKHS